MIVVEGETVSEPFSSQMPPPRVVPTGKVTDELALFHETGMLVSAQSPKRVLTISDCTFSAEDETASTRIGKTSESSQARSPPLTLAPV